MVAKIEKGVVKPFCQNVGMSDDLRRYYILCLVIIQYLLPLIIITGAYIRMAAQLWGATAPGNKEESRDAVVLRNKKKVTVNILIFWKMHCLRFPLIKKNLRKISVAEDLY